MADPYGYLAALHGECPLRREKHHNVVMVTGYDEGMAIYNDTERFSSCISVTGPFPGFPAPLEGDDVSGPMTSCRRSIRRCIPRTGRCALPDDHTQAVCRKTRGSFGGSPTASTTPRRPGAAASSSASWRIRSRYRCGRSGGKRSQVGRRLTSPLPKTVDSVDGMVSRRARICAICQSPSSKWRTRDRNR